MPKVQLRMESMGREDSESFRAGYAAWLAEEESERRASKKAQGEVCMDVVVGKLVELAAGFTPSKSTAAPVVVPVLPPGHSSSPIIRNLDYQDHHASNRTLPMAWSVFWVRYTYTLLLHSSTRTDLSSHSHHPALSADAPHQGDRETEEHRRLGPRAGDQRMVEARVRQRCSLVKDIV
jgi:hypothetical protein